MDRLEQAIEIGADIKALRTKIEEMEAEVAAKERELESLLARKKPTPQARSATVAPPPVDGRSIDDRVWDALKKSKHLMDAPMLKEKLPDIEIASIRASLSRMVKQERVERRERGKYQ